MTVKLLPPHIIQMVSITLILFFGYS